MVVLGFNGGDTRPEDDDAVRQAWHDAAAVLLDGPRIVAAIEEERLDRIKHSNCFPERAIRACLEIGGMSLSDVDRIALAYGEAWPQEWARRAFLEDPTRPVSVDASLRVSRLFRDTFAEDVGDRLRFCHHHIAHAWSAYVFSGFDHAVVMTIDGMGDDCSGMILLAGDGRLEVLRKIPVSQSLGALYTDVIQLIGFFTFDEYKAMGLAPYGDPSRYQELFREGYRLLPEGRYVVDARAAWLDRFSKAGLLAGARRAGQPFAQPHMDVAAALQRTLERITIHVLTHFRATTGAEHLCLAGGVAHNCSLNGRILASGLFRGVFVQPAAHDAGAALGAALSVATGNEPVRTRTMPVPYLGRHIGTEDDIRRHLQDWSRFVDVERLDDVASATASLLAGGAIVGWVQGRSEFGPRALGNRSIFGDPRPAANRDRINAMVKKREGFRPFAASVLAEEAGTYFDLPDTCTSFSFMTYVVPVRSEWRIGLGAITHVDGSSRIQTVSRQDNPLFWRLIDSFRRETGVALLLNTSFNSNAEPIVDSVEDAVTCYLTSGLDFLVVGNCLVRRRGALRTSPHLTKLVPSLPLWCKLEKAVRHPSDTRPPYQVVSRKRTTYRRHAVDLSAGMFRLLCEADGRLTLGQLLTGVEAGADAVDPLIRESLELWTARMISLRPAHADTRPRCNGRTARDSGGHLVARI